ncbi:MAG: outer membrane beta-barrel protein [Candidatus Eisenbacteria bacterium]
MHPRACLLALLLLLSPTLSHAQANSLRGKFMDPTSNSPISGVQVKLTNFADSSDVQRAVGREDGTFEVSGLGSHSYRLEAMRLGFATLKIVIRVTQAKQEAGVLALTPESVEISGVTVTESPAPAIQKADTTEFRASAVKTSKDATAEDLVQKLPGVTVENGQVKTNGENVQQVLVNGKPFFGSDPTAAMRNLPADEIDRIQVYDRMGDQAEFSGFEDGTAQRTMNFILRNQKAKFGKVYAGYGDRDRYQAGGNATLVRGATRVTVLGMSNNINQLNFSPQDLFGSMSSGGGGGGTRMMMMMGGGGPRGGGGAGQMMRMGGGGFGGGGFDPSSFMVNGLGGVSTTHSGGANYVGQWGKKLSVSSSLFLNDSDNDNTQALSREYLPPQDSIAFYDQHATTTNQSGNQRFDARFEWTPDSLNSVILAPRLYFQQTDARSLGRASNNTIDGMPLSSSQSNTFSSTQGDNLSSRLTLRHRFAKRGRNVSADLNAGHSLRDTDGTLFSVSDFDTSGSSPDSTRLDQISNSRTTTRSFSTRLAFTEPINKYLQAQAIYNPSLTRSESNARAFDLEPLSGTYTSPESTLSNSYENRNTVQNGGLALLFTKGVWKLLSNTSYQRTQLRSEETFPGSRTVEHTFENLLPSLTLTATFANRRNLRLAYATSTAAPTISQLQNVVNNSNPLSLSIGNPDLRQTYNNTLTLRVSEADPLKSKSRFLFANLTRTSDPIANSTYTALTDTVVDGVTLARGTQLSKPVNLNESWNANAFAAYSFPVKHLKSILSFNGGGSFSRTPSRSNNLTNVGSTYAVRSGTVLSSNISPNLDFTVSYQGTYNISRSTLSTSTSSAYYTHRAGMRLNVVMGPGIVLRQELNHNLQSGASSSYRQNVLLWNTTLGKKLLKGDKGELRLTATDVLEQDRSVNRSFTETYVQDSRDRTLGRYVQAVFTYSFK